MHAHRVEVVRPEARSTQLAYGFARGVPYRVIEPRGSGMDVKRVAAIIRSLTGEEVLPHDIAAWIEHE
jgi:hypothetical protein